MVLEHLKELNRCKFCGNELVPIGLDYLCANISNGLPVEIAARQKQYEYYRDKLLTFKELKKS